MIKGLHLLILSIIILISTPSYGKLRELELTITPNLKNKESLYQQILFIDGRSELEKKSLKINEEQFNNQLNSLIFKSETKHCPKKNIVVLLRNLYFQFVNERDQKDQYVLRISLFENKNNTENLHFINTLNICLSAEEDNETIDKSRLSGAICMFIYNHIDQSPQAFAKDHPTNTLSSLIVLEKSRIELYNKTILTDGIYNSFSTLSQQKPDAKVSSFKQKDFYLYNIKRFDPKSQKETKVKSKDTYAVIVEGCLFLQINKKYIPLYKDSDNDFCFRLKKSPDIFYPWELGLTGALLKIIRERDKVPEGIDLKIDYMDGKILKKEEENNDLYIYKTTKN